MDSIFDVINNRNIRNVRVDGLLYGKFSNQIAKFTKVFNKAAISDFFSTVPWFAGSSIPWLVMLLMSNTKERKLFLKECELIEKSITNDS